MFLGDFVVEGVFSLFVFEVFDLYEKLLFFVVDLEKVFGNWVVEIRFWVDFLVLKFFLFGLLVWFFFSLDVL